MSNVKPYYSVNELKNHAFIKAFQHKDLLAEIRFDKKGNSFYLVSQTGRIPKIGSVVAVINASNEYLSSGINRNVHLGTIDIERSMYFSHDAKYHPLNACLYDQFNSKSSLLNIVDSLIVDAQGELTKLETDPNYYESAANEEFENKFFDNVSAVMGFDIKPNEEMHSLFIKASVDERYKFAIVNLRSLKKALGVK